MRLYSKRKGVRPQGETPFIVQYMYPVSGNDILPASIITQALKDGSIATAKIEALAVTTAKINLLAVTEAQIGALAVTEAKIGALAVTNAKIGLLAVDTAQIAASAIETAKINNLAVTEAKIGALAVTEAKIGNLAVTSGKIALLAVDTAQIAALAVTDAKINDCAIGKLTAGTITADVTISNTFKTAASPNPRIEITSSYIAGYSDETTKQFYIQASDGKGYFGAGACVLDSGGVTIKGERLTLQDGNGANSKVIYVDVTGYLRIPGTIKSGDLQPGADDSILLGTADFRWSDFYTCTAWIYDQLKIPLKSTTGDPTALEAVIYVNTYDNKIRCYADGAWRDLATW